jgi:hypothetical protein
MACSVCNHSDRPAIDKALATGHSKRRIAADHGLSESAIYRHVDEHLPARIVKAQERTDVREALDIVGQLKLVNAAALAVLKQARDSRDGELMLKATDRILKQVELQAKLLGELDDRPVVNVLVAPEWLELRVVLMGALRGHPDAQRDVIEAISAHAS